jgi:hypothetical protein
LLDGQFGGKAQGKVSDNDQICGFIVTLRWNQRNYGVNAKITP